MSRLILREGDRVLFDTVFGHRQVSVTGNAVLSASGHASIAGRRICVAGDEQKVRVAATYLVAGHAAGAGTLSIARLGVDQQVRHVVSGQAVLVEGSSFVATFTPTTLALQIGSNTPDSPAPGTASGRFVASQQFVGAG